MKCKDYLVSGELFNLEENKEYKMLITSPFPKENKLGEYYKNDNYTSHTDGKKKTTIDKLYLIARNYLLKRKLKLINLYSKTSNKNILDYGCGTGEFLKVCENFGYTTNGIEPNKDALELAKKKIKGNLYNNKKLKEIEDNKYDIITLWHILEHIPNLKEVIINLKRILKNDGTLIIAVPNYNSFDAKYYKEFWAGYDVPRHLWHFSKYSIHKLFYEVEMKVIKTKPMWLDSTYVSILSEKHRNSKFNLIKGFIIGFISNLYFLLKKECSSHIYIL